MALLSHSCFNVLESSILIQRQLYPCNLHWCCNDVDDDDGDGNNSNQPPAASKRLFNRPVSVTIQDNAKVVSDKQGLFGKQY